MKKSSNSVVFVQAKTVSTSLKQKNAPGEVMERINQEQVRTLIGRFYIHNYHTGKVFTFKHFSTIEIQKSLIYRVIQRYEEGSKPSTSLELEDLPRNYLLNMLDNLYLNPLVELAFPCKNWPPNMEFLPGMLEKPLPRMMQLTGNVNPAPAIHPGRLREQELQLMILK